MNELISTYLNEYLENPDPQYAIMIKGVWGCGKTFFIKNWIHNIKQNNINKEDEIILSPIYVSLYGLHTVSEIRCAIDRELHPFFYSKTGKYLRNAAKLIGKVAFRTSLDFNDDGKEDGTFSTTLDTLTLLTDKDNNIEGTKFLVFDDLERCLIDTKELLGFINYFVEHCGCHVVMIGDDTHMEDSAKYVFADFKEKTVGREFVLQTDVDGAISFFLDETPCSKYLQAHREDIIKAFTATKYSNLRVLRQCLYDFKMQISSIDEDCAKDDNSFVHGLLSSFIAVYAEYKSGVDKSVLENFKENYQFAIYTKTNEAEKIRSLRKKYDCITQYEMYHPINPMYVEPIVRHIQEGIFLSEYIAQHMLTETPRITSWMQLGRFRDLEDDVFHQCCMETKNALLDDSIDDLSQVGCAYALLISFDSMNLYALSKEVNKRIEKNIHQRIRCCNSLETMYKERNKFLSGLSSIRIEEVTTDVFLSVRENFQKWISEREKKLPNKMQIELRVLSDNNVENLPRIDRESYPDNRSNYQLTAIFEYESSAALFERLKWMSNIGRNKFSGFLEMHYFLGGSVSGVGNRYSADVRCLTGLKRMICKELSVAHGLTKISYQRLQEVLTRSIRRCKGDERVF